MNIITAAETDLENIASLYVRNHKATYSGLLSAEYLSHLTYEYAFRKWDEFMRCLTGKIWVAREDEALLGFAAGMPDSDLPHTWYLESLQVEESARGKGIGTALIRAAGRFAADQGYERMSICIVRGNNRAGSLYQKLGAEHYSFFEDDFCGTPSSSEKLLWHNLPIAE